MIKFSGKWGRNKDGTTAIEMSFLFMPYLLLSLGIIEMSLMFASESMLEGATTRSARIIKTGQLQQVAPENMEAEFRRKLCTHLPAMIDCEAVVVEARVMENFADFDDMQPSFDEDGRMVSSGFALGGSSSKVLVRVSYNYQAYAPFVGHLLYGEDNSRLFISTIVLQSEPYDFSAETLAGGEF